MLPILRSSQRHRRRGLLAMSLLFVGLCTLINLHHLLYQPSRERQTSGHQKNVLPPELVEFVKAGGFDETEKIVEPTPDAPKEPIQQTVVTTTNKNEAFSEQHNDKKDRTTRLEKPNREKKHHRYYGKEKMKRHEGFPPLDRLISHEEEEVTGPVDWLLDFAILGHAKCATTYLMNWLRQHDSVQMHGHEVCDLNNRQPASLVRKLYTDLPSGEQYLRGFKCPGHFSREPLRYFRQYFQKTKLIVGLRHPVRWFESYYNFRIRHPRGGSMPPPERLLGKCLHESQGVCTDRANFHRNLAMLAKTNLSEPAQQALLVGLPPKYRMGLSEIPNAVFLYDVGQLYDINAQRMAKFQSDLEDFVGLDSPLPSNYTESSSSKSDAKFSRLDICNSDFDQIRQELVAIASRAATWIIEYFIHSDSVFVSSPEYFAEILQTWHYDPCIKATS